LLGCGTPAAGLELHGLHQTGGHDFHRVDHAFALKPDFSLRAADVVTREFDPVSQAQHVGMGQAAKQKKR